jgi:hypothetical protein
MILFLYSDRDERFGRDRPSRDDRVSLWWFSVMMVMFFLILVIFLMQAFLSKPANKHPTESAWYCHALPLFNILSQERSGSVLPLPCHTRFTPQTPFGHSPYRAP